MTGGVPLDSVAGQQRPATVFVDADACPVRERIVRACREYGVPVVLVADHSHHFADGYSQVVLVDQGRDSADLAILNRLQAGDVVVTQDYGVAAMALAKRAYAMHQSGREYTTDNIDFLLLERHESGKRRRAGGRLKGPKPRRPEEDEAFEAAFRALLCRICQKN